MTAHLRVYTQCEISWADDGSYVDNCGSTITSKLTCQPVGPQSVARLASKWRRPAVGTQCDLGPQSCDSGILFVFNQQL